MLQFWISAGGDAFRTKKIKYYLSCMELRMKDELEINGFSGNPLLLRTEWIKCLLSVEDNFTITTTSLINKMKIITKHKYKSDIIRFVLIIRTSDILIF